MVVKRSCSDQGTKLASWDQVRHRKLPDPEANTAYFIMIRPPKTKDSCSMAH